MQATAAHWLPRPGRPALVPVLALAAVLAPCAGGQTGEPSTDAWSAVYENGLSLWETLAPGEWRRDYRFPAREDWDRFWSTIEDALHEGSAEDLATLRPYARDAVAAMRAIPPLQPFAAWLHARLDYFDAGELGTREQRPAATRPPDRTAWTRTPARSAHASQPALPAAIRDEQFWQRRLARRAFPARAGELVPRLKPIFAAEAVPPELVWLAEVESSMRPDARSPVGALGLFQLMPATAERFGLRLRPEDERRDPEKSARAAARYLALLHRQFNSWPLALAAYNAGEGRVGRTLKQQQADTFEAVAVHLPTETQLYVPKVLATVRAREGLDLR